MTNYIIASGTSKQDDITATNHLFFFDCMDEAQEALATFPNFKSDFFKELYSNPRIVSEKEAIKHVYGRANFDCKKRNQYEFWTPETGWLLS